MTDLYRGCIIDVIAYQWYKTSTDGETLLEKACVTPCDVLNSMLNCIDDTDLDYLRQTKLDKYIDYYNTPNIWNSKFGFHFYIVRNFNDDQPI